MSGEFPDVAKTVTQIQFVNVLLFFSEKNEQTKQKQNRTAAMNFFLEFLYF